MFRMIYEPSWGFEDKKIGSPDAFAKLQGIYTRLVEELSELIESVRFFHLYPSNFDNELADYFAWFFALVSSIDKVSPGREPILLEELLWPAYPGVCMVCLLDICDCRPRPVRELLSKPSLRALELIDSLTQANNVTSFDRDVSAVEKNDLPWPLPIACVRIDLDDFKRFNEPPFDHGFGDSALQHFATIVRQKIRNRDRLYRVGGDEFAIMCPDLSAEETHGMMIRVANALKEKLIPGTASDGSKPPSVTVSVGIVECGSRNEIKDAFAMADKEAINSKKAGKDRITVATK
jgi:diguanylate cyclase (GGDEF)-like protein